MPKSRNRKNHKQKSQARKDSIDQQKRKAEKAQREFIMKIIEQEKNKGLFQNNPTLGIDGPQITIDGPTI